MDTPARRSYLKFAALNTANIAALAAVKIVTIVAQYAAIIMTQSKGDMFVTKKNLVAALSAVLVVSAAGSVFAAPVTITGSVKGTVEYQQKLADAWQGGRGKQDIQLATEIKAGDKTKAVVVFGHDANGEKLMGKDPSTARNLGGIRVDSAYVETTGALYNGGQEFTTTLGDIDATYSEYIANVTGKEGVKVEGVKVGPMALKGFYGFNTNKLVDGPDKDEKGNPIKVSVLDVPAVYGTQANAKVAGLDITGTALRQAKESSAHGRVAFSPVKGIDVATDYAVTQDEAINDKMRDALNVDAKAVINPVLTLRGGYRNFDADFAPKYAKFDDGDGDASTLTFMQQNVGDKAYHVGADMNIAGIAASVDHDRDMAEGVNHNSNWVEGKASKTVAGFGLSARVKANDWTKYSDSTFGVTKELPVAGLKLATSYTLDHNKAAQTLKHVAKASTSMNIWKLQNVALNSEFDYTTDSINKTNTTDYSFGSSYTAPNGLAIGAGYSKSKGVNANAGMTVSF